MSTLVVELSHLEAGVVLAEDVYVNTMHPIVRKDTIISDEHVNVLRTFSIKEVKVKSDSTVRSAEEKDAADHIEKTEPVQEVKSPPFQEKYIEAVQQVKKEFVKWRAGVQPDIAKMRTIIVPLLEQLKRPKNELSFLSRVATKEDYIYHHSVAVGLLAYAIGEKMNLSSGETIQLAIAGTLIDCGMARVSPPIVNKVGPLTAKEYNEVKKHPIYSYQMVNDSPLLKTEMKLAILQHHERLDGSGYPRQEKDKNITLYAQILSAADVYHARTSDRIYRAKESPYTVLESFKNTYESFNVQVINALYDVAGRLSIGTSVRLSNNEIGTIVYLHQTEPFRPVVKLVANEEIIDLTKMRGLIIEEVL